MIEFFVQHITENIDLLGLAQRWELMPKSQRQVPPQSPFPTPLSSLPSPLKKAHILTKNIKKYEKVTPTKYQHHQEGDEKEKEPTVSPEK